MPESDASEVGAERDSASRTKLIVLALIAITIAIVYFQFGDMLTIDYLAQRELQLRAIQAEHPTLVYGAAFLIYVTVAGLSLPGAAALTLVYGWYFGFTPTLILVSFASTLGAMLAFWLSRYLFRESYNRRFGKRLTSFNQSLEREGPFFLFTIRMIPAIPFFIVNSVMGLTPIGSFTFWWISQLGMLPGTAVFTYAGSRVPSLATLSEQGVNAVFNPSQLAQILTAFALLGISPLIVRFFIHRLGRN